MMQQEQELTDAIMMLHQEGYVTPGVTVHGKVPEPFHVVQE